jgi:cell division protein FtsN
MTRVLKILAVAAFLFVLWMWGSVMFKSCNPDNDFNFTMPEREDKLIENTDSLLQEEDFFEEEDAILYSDNLKTKTSDSLMKREPQKVQESIHEVANNESPTLVGTKSNSKTVESDKIEDISTPRNQVNGLWLVICGSYKDESNAIESIKKLKKLGFSGAEKVKFDASNFHTVLSGRYESQNEAAKASALLKQKGIDSYVKKSTK